MRSLWHCKFCWLDNTTIFFSEAYKSYVSWCPILTCKFWWRQVGCTVFQRLHVASEGIDKENKLGVASTQAGASLVCIDMLLCFEQRKMLWQFVLPGGWEMHTWTAGARLGSGNTLGFGRFLIGEGRELENIDHEKNRNWVHFAFTEEEMNGQEEKSVFSVTLRYVQSGSVHDIRHACNAGRGSENCSIKC